MASRSKILGTIIVAALSAVLCTVDAYPGCQINVINSTPFVLRMISSAPTNNVAPPLYLGAGQNYVVQGYADVVYNYDVRTNTGVGRIVCTNAMHTGLRSSNHKL